MTNLLSVLIAMSCGFYRSNRIASNCKASICIGLCAIAAVAVLPSPLLAQHIYVAVRGQVNVSQPSTIRIGDVADITGGSTNDRNRIAQLDLESFRSASHCCQIDRRQIEMRLLVDGFSREQISVTGSQSVLVSNDTPSELRPRLESEFADEIGRQFAMEASSVSVRFTNEMQLASVQKKLAGESFTTTVLLSPQLPMGKTSIEVEFHPTSGQRFVERFDTQVIVSISLAVAKQPIGRGRVLAASMFDVVSRPMIRKTDSAQAGHVIGRVAKRDIASNDVILRSYLAEPASHSEPVIKRNDLLDVIVPLGASEVRLKNARAISMGEVGDTITVLNTQSNRQLSAVVVDRNLARVLPLTGRSVARRATTKGVRR